MEQISKELKKLHASIMQGTHKFGGEDLSFMPLVRQWKDRIPFQDLLHALNTTHKVSKVVL